MILVIYPKIINRRIVSAPVGNVLDASLPFSAGRGDVDDGKMMRGRWSGVTS
jgi:hypothetical protein